MIPNKGALSAALLVTLLLAGLEPVAAQGEEAAANLPLAYQALLEQAKQHSWTAVVEQAQKVLRAAAALDPQSLTPEQLYMVGMAHYWLLGLAMQAALQGGGLAPEQVQFAEQIAGMVFGGAGPDSIKVIGRGERVTLEEHLFPGKTTIVDFYSEFCPPCRAIAPVLEKLVRARSDLGLLKVDINRPGHQGIDWGSPVAQQFNLTGIPHLRIYDAQGQLIAQGQQAHGIIMRWVDELPQN